MPSSNTKTSKKSTAPKKSSTSGAKKKTDKKTSSSKSNKKSSTSSAKQSRSQEGFKKTKIPVKVINTPQVDEGRKLHPVPETAPESGVSLSGIRSQTKSEANNIPTSPKTEDAKKTEKKEEIAAAEDSFFEALEEDEEKTDDSSFKEETETVPVKKQKKPRKKPLSFNLYRKIAVTFIVLTLLLVGGVVYFSLPGLKITLTPENGIIKDDVSINVYSDSEKEASQVDEPAIAGIVDQVEVEEEKKFQSTGARTIGKEIEGKVRIINNYNQDQSLVETTRLLSPEEKLYRISEDVVVPAGGSVEVEIYSDEPEPEMAIGPTEFTIPGLWAGLQDDIYAESEEEFEYRVKIKRYVQQSDIDKAKEDIRNSLEEKMDSEFGDSYKGKDRVILKLDEDSVETSVNVEANDEEDEFMVETSGKVNIVALNDDEIAGLAKQRLSSLVSGENTLSELDKSSFSFNLKDFDYEEGVASVNVSFAGQTVPTGDSDIIDKKEIVDLDREQLISYLDNVEGIKDYQVDFTPSFIQKVPDLSDRIEINIQTQ